MKQFVIVVVSLVNKLHKQFFPKNKNIHYDIINNIIIKTILIRGWTVPNLASSIFSNNI